VRLRGGFLDLGDLNGPEDNDHEDETGDGDDELLDHGKGGELKKGRRKIRR
jgi:hypothetical protein